MCGITGILTFNEEGKKHLHKISAATYSLFKRGPDGEGIYTLENVALGHRRLAIIDTSNAAAQPFTDTSGRFTTVFNGEIFNYLELRKQLENTGIQFRSQSDTEVLLYLYIREKEKCLEKLDGEFAFANYPDLPAYVKDNAQEMDEEVMRSHINLYVNDFSLELGKKGRAAVWKLMEIASTIHPKPVEG